MRFKDDVNPHGLRPEILAGLLVADSVFRQHKAETWVTSICDGQHSRTSLHYAGQAVDLDMVPQDERLMDQIAQEIRERLPVPFYDVIRETTHIHIEYQPKR